MARALINVPSSARRGSIVEIKALIAHPMETGYRVDDSGATVPRNIITRFVCTYRGEEIFSADLFPAMTANPFVAFSTIATESGEIVFTWTGDNGFDETETATITVT